MTLAVLAAYRGLGIGKGYQHKKYVTRNTFLSGALLVNKVSDNAAKHEVARIYLHVQENNDDAIEFYKKQGFAVTERAENYYVRIEPPHAVIVSKTM